MFDFRHDGCVHRGEIRPPKGTTRSLLTLMWCDIINRDLPCDAHMVALLQWLPGRVHFSDLEFYGDRSARTHACWFARSFDAARRAVVALCTVHPRSQWELLVLDASFDRVAALSTQEDGSVVQYHDVRHCFTFVEFDPARNLLSAKGWSEPQDTTAGSGTLRINSETTLVSSNMDMAASSLEGRWLTPRFTGRQLQVHAIGRPKV